MLLQKLPWGEKYFVLEQCDKLSSENKTMLILFIKLNIYSMNINS